MSSHIQEQKRIKVAEIVCDRCERPAWIYSQGQQIYHCPYCFGKSWINEESISIEVSKNKLKIKTKL